MTRPMSDAEFEMLINRGNEAMAETGKNLQMAGESSSSSESFVTSEALTIGVNHDTSESDPFSRQVGGSHYKQYKIQPYEFFFKNNIPHHKAAIIRRILRFDHATGKGMTDLDKIIHEVELIKTLWEKENATPSDKS